MTAMASDRGVNLKLRTTANAEYQTLKKNKKFWAE
jgi:hypothetical protein